MHRLRGLVATGFLLVTGISASSCGSSGASNGSGGSGGTDASMSDATGAGGMGATDGGGTGGASTNGPDAAFDAGPHPDPALCGNGSLDRFEDCDPPDHTKGCTPNCRFFCTAGEASEARCSDHNPCNGEEKCNPDHTCQPAGSSGNVPDKTRCGESHTCRAGVCGLADLICGDGLVVPILTGKPGEECDPPDGMGCASKCMFTCLSTDPTRDCSSKDPCVPKAVCNDLTHICEVKGNPLKDLTPCEIGTTKKCQDGVCTDKYCSNRVVDPGEECDDGNRVDGDGCDNTCKYSCSPTDTTRDCHSMNACITGGTCNTGTHRCSPDAPKTAGTACGNKGNCVEGNCIAPKCGDGIVASGVESCDDGNAVAGDGCDNDCTPSCVTAAADCTGTPTCRTAICASGKCSSAADGSKDNSPCDTGGGAATCHAGACTKGTCGNGSVDVGEQCDDNNLTAGDGCEPNCTYTCTLDSQCNDGDPCNGVETCDPGRHKCQHPSGQPDGTGCGTGKICVSSSCRPSFCGDGIISAGEACEPPNTVGCNDVCKARELCILDGDWAMRITANVIWGDPTGGGALMSSDELVAANPGFDTAIRQWAKLSIKQTGTSFTAKLFPCGLTIPDFQTRPILGGEWYGLVFANSAFDATTMPTFGFLGTVSSQLIGAAFNTSPPIAILLGVTVGPPSDPLLTAWPDDPTIDGFTVVDSDNDGNPGVTGTVKSGAVPGIAACPPSAPKTCGQYQNIIVTPDGSNPPASLVNSIRGDAMYLAIRQISSQIGTISACTGGSATAITGTADVQIDNHIVGCELVSGNACSTDQWGLPDTVRPEYSPDPNAPATFVAQKLTGSSTCAAVRSALP